MTPSTVEPAHIDVQVDGARRRYVCRGNWTIGGVNSAEELLSNEQFAQGNTVEFDTTAVSNFDSAGAWLVARTRAHASDTGAEFKHVDNNINYIRLVDVVAPQSINAAEDTKKRSNFILSGLESFGRGAETMFKDVITACYLVGSSIRGPQMKAGRRGGIRLKSIIHHLNQMGLNAVPVIALMSFLIGGIIAQQGAYQLRAYGEELLTVNLVGVLHFREIAVLLTAIMVAGRTGSAITAEIGTMKMREEIDALQVIGLNPVGVLIFPRLLALIIALPILVLLSDVFGMLGAIVVADLYIGITPGEFLEALRSGIAIDHFFVGIIKSPVMAIIIGLAASVEGLKVGGSAESLGKHTTSSVVRAIFTVIVVDGLFAMFFAAIGY